MGVPQARWLVYFMEDPNLEWMMTGGTPIFWNTQLSMYLYVYIYI